MAHPDILPRHLAQTPQSAAEWLALADMDPEGARQLWRRGLPRPAVPDDFDPVQVYLGARAAHSARLHGPESHEARQAGQLLAEFIGTTLTGLHFD